MKALFFSLALLPILFSCQEEDDKPGPNLIFRFKFDPTQERLNSFGQPAAMPEGHAGQNPSFNKISAHYFELTPNALTALGSGEVLYLAPEVTTGGAKAIDFSQSNPVAAGENALSIPLKSIQAGSYEYLRVSLAYQNYDVNFRFGGNSFTGTLASFIGYRTYIGSYTVKNQSVSVNANKSQGYWGFETISGVVTGQAPGTTVPNPIFATSPIPSGSCVVTAAFSTPLLLTGKETQDIVVEMSLSTNKSFEWEDKNSNGQWDTDGAEPVVDMGIRGMRLSVKR